MPSIDLIAFISGIILVVLAVLGGGIVMEKVQIPVMTTHGRTGSFFMGCLLLVLGVWLHNAPHRLEPTPIPYEILPTPKTIDTSTPNENISEFIYPAPLYEGRRLDACYLFAKECGEKPAYEWCKYKGRSGLKEFVIENVGVDGIETLIMGTGNICKEKYCSAFKSITCM